MYVQLTLWEGKYHIPGRQLWVGSGRRAVLSSSLMKLLVLCTDTWSLPYWAPSSVSEKKEQFQPLCIQRKRACGQAGKRLFPQWGCWSSLGLLSAELHLVWFNFCLFAAAIFSGPSWLKCLVSIWCLTTGPALLEVIVGPGSSISTKQQFLGLSFWAGMEELPGSHSQPAVTDQQCHDLLLLF